MHPVEEKHELSEHNRDSSAGCCRCICNPILYQANLKRERAASRRQSLPVVESEVGYGKQVRPAPETVGIRPNIGSWNCERFANWGRT
jgi:hypothetical protein